MVTLLLDSSIIIDFLRSRRGLLVKLFINNKAYRIKIPSIVVFELYRGHSTKSQKILKELTTIIEKMEVIPLTSQIAKVAGVLERDGYVRGNDALIAATSLVKNHPLTTNNLKHFLTVPHLKLFKLP